MNIAIQNDTVTILGGGGETYKTTITISVGAARLFAVGRGATAAASEQEAERSVAAAGEDLDQLGEIRRRTGGVRWGALEAVAP